jgi:multicomponent K+:H+ antiporter subunit E
MSVVRALLPYPGSSAALALFWLVLVDELSAGQIVLAAVLGLLVPIVTRRFRAVRPPLRRAGAAVRLAGVFAYDLVRANFAVAGAVLGSPARIQPRFLRVPLDLEDPAATAVLAGVVTLTPGTVSVDIDASARALTVHVLLPGDEHALVHHIKTQYEARIQEIFQC